MTAINSTAKAPARATPAPHIVDALIEERAPKLAASPLWPLMRLGLYRILGYQRARRMADRIAPMQGVEALDYVSSLLALKVTAKGLERLPRTGAAIVIANHPTGIADGVAAYDALKTVRSDLVFYANGDAHRVCAGFEGPLIPVELNATKRSREATRRTLHATNAALEAGKMLVIFPAGRLARVRSGVFIDEPWTPTAVSLARKFAAPVLPMHVDGPWSTLFHFFDRFSGELRDITLFQELLNKKGRAFRLTVGEAIDAARIPGEPPEATLLLKAYVEGPLSTGQVQFTAT